MAAFRQALKLDPNLVEARHNLGRALDEKGERRAALKEFRLSQKLKPKDSAIRADYGRLSQELIKVPAGSPRHPTGLIRTS